MARQTNDAYVVSHVLTTKLCAQTNLISLLKYLLLQLYVAERTAILVTGCRQLIVIMGRGQLHGQQVLLRRGTTDHKCDVVRRTSGCTQGLHLLYQEGNQGVGIQHSLCLLIQIGLVGRATTLRHAKELILHALSRLDVDLSRQVALGVHLIVHIQRGIL